MPYVTCLDSTKVTHQTRYYTFNAMATNTKDKKRLLYEFDDLAAVNSPRRFVKLHGVITEVSGMTESDKYFEGRLADDKASVLRHSTTMTRSFNGFKTACGTAQLYDP